MSAAERAGIAALALLLVTACGLGAEQAERREMHRGVSWEAIPREITAEDFESLAATGANWISQTAFGWQTAYDRPEIVIETEKKIFWGETEEGLTVTTRLAREKGIRTLLKPHVWLPRSPSGKWRSDIAMTTPEDWEAWWRSYRGLILTYARLGERIGAEGLAVGTELLGVVRHGPEPWRRLIADVRKVFSGRLTYAANWYEEYEAVSFWDDLDFIGIQAYFPLAPGDSPSLEEIQASWKPHLEAIARLQKRYGKPVVFTELGYRSAPGSLAEPWHWPEDLPEDIAPDLELQARAYRAFFETFWERPWFGGVYVWKWHPGNYEDLSKHNGFTPQGKPALAVMTEWFRR